MKSLNIKTFFFSFLLILIYAEYSSAEDAELIVIDNDAEEIQYLRENGWYGRLLEVLGKNEEALTYYQADGEKDINAQDRTNLLKWYFGLDDPPSFISKDFPVSLIAEYYESGGSLELPELKSDIPDTLELDALLKGNLFILPFLFESEQRSSSSLPPIADQSQNEDGYTNESVQMENVVDSDMSLDEVVIQVGSFREEENAVAHLKHLKEKNIDAHLKRKTYNGEVFYITVTYPGDNIQNALVELKEKGIEGFPLYP